MKVGMAFNPDTQIPHNLTNFIGDLDMVLLMTVQPGFGGQKFREYVL
jgi:ribulose-phosphate 3-epimerase